MAKHTLPNIGLTGGYVAGEDGWGDEQNANLLKLSVLVQGGAKSRVAAVPGAPAQGDVHILTGAPNDNAVAVYDAAAWVYFAPSEGWLLFDRDANVYVTFDGADWTVLETGGGGGGATSDLYRFGGFFTSEPAASEVLLLHVATDAFSLPDDFAGSRIEIGTNPSAVTVLAVERNGVAAGTISVSAAGVATFTTTGGALAVAAGDLLTVTAPADSNGLADVAFTFRGAGVLSGGVTEAPVDGSAYARKDGAWVAAAAGGGGGGSPLFKAGGSFEYTSGGVLTFSDLAGCIVERIAAGRYKVTFNTPALNTQYGVIATAKWNTYEAGNYSAPVVGMDRGYDPSVTVNFFYLVCAETGVGAKYDGRVMFSVFESAAKLIASAGGGGGSPWYFDPPLAADFVLTNSGITNMAATDDADVGLILSAPSFNGGLNTAFAMQAVPAGSWTATARLEGSPYPQEYNGLGMCLRAADGKFYAFGVRAYGASPHAMLNRWSSGTAFNADGPPTLPSVDFGTSPWRRIVYDSGTATLKFQISANGKAWQTIDTDPVAEFLGAPAEIGLFMGGNVPAAGGDFMKLTVDHWSVI